MGRPSSFTQQIADEICEKISTSSIGLRHILVGDKMPTHNTLLRWIRENEAFYQQYARAKEAQADYMAEEILDIVDDGSNDLMTIIKGDNIYEQENKEVTSRSKMRYEARRWLMGKLRPKKYGDKLEIDGNVNNIATTEMLAVLADKINANAAS